MKTFDFRQHLLLYCVGYCKHHLSDYKESMATEKSLKKKLHCIRRKSYCEF